MDPFKASIAIATVNGGPSIEFYMCLCAETRVKIGYHWVGRIGKELTSRDEVPPATDLLPHVEEDPVLLFGPRRLGDAWVEFLTEAFSGLIVRSTRKVFGDLMPAVTVLADSLQE